MDKNRKFQFFRSFGSESAPKVLQYAQNVLIVPVYTYSIRKIMIYTYIQVIPEKLIFYLTYSTASYINKISRYLRPMNPKSRSKQAATTSIRTKIRKIVPSLTYLKICRLKYGHKTPLF